MCGAGQTDTSMSRCPEVSPRYAASVSVSSPVSCLSIRVRVFALGPCQSPCRSPTPLIFSVWRCEWTGHVPPSAVLLLVSVILRLGDMACNWSVRMRQQTAFHTLQRSAQRGSTEGNGGLARSRQRHLKLQRVGKKKNRLST